MARTNSKTTDNIPFLQTEGAGHGLVRVPEPAPLCNPMPAEFGTARQRAVTVRIPKIDIK